MGHIRLPSLPRTRKWQEVVALLGSRDGSVQSVAAATLDALSDAFVDSGTDSGLVRAVWLLASLPDAARSEDFVRAARDLGITIPANPTTTDLATGLSNALDDYLDKSRRTDLAEIAVAASVEAVSRTLGHRTKTLFPSPDDTTYETAKLATEKQFSRLARDFFARFTQRWLTSFIDRDLPNHTGNGRRFQTIDDQREFSQALSLHCEQASRIVEAFAGGWWSKARFEGDLSEQRTGRFVSYSLKKLRDELARGGSE